MSKKKPTPNFKSQTCTLVKLLTYSKIFFFYLLDIIYLDEIEFTYHVIQKRDYNSK